MLDKEQWKKLLEERGVQLDEENGKIILTFKKKNK